MNKCCNTCNLMRVYYFFELTKAVMEKNIPRGNLNATTNLRSSTCHQLRRLHARCPTCSAASLCAWCTALDQAESLEKHVPHVRRHMCPARLPRLVSVLLCVLPSFPDTCPFSCAPCPGFPDCDKQKKGKAFLGGEGGAMVSNGVHTR